MPARPARSTLPRARIITMLVTDVQTPTFIHVSFFFVSLRFKHSAPREQILTLRIEFAPRCNKV